MSETINMLDYPCDCCGLSSSQSGRTIAFVIAREESSALCDLCERLIAEGLLRPETVDGELRYRQWHYQPMTPGELLPKRERR